MRRYPEKLRCLTLCGMILLMTGLTLFLQNDSGAVSARTLGKVSLAGSSENWTQNWEIQDTLAENNSGLEAGFHRRMPSNRSIRLSGGDGGFVCMFPQSKYKPATLFGRNIKIREKTDYLRVTLAASSTPRGLWRFECRVNGKPFADPVDISGEDGWQVVGFNLSVYQGQSIDISLEATAVRSGKDASAYIDDISMQREDGKPDEMVSVPEGDEGLFDKWFREFLNLWRQKEDLRQERMMDQTYQDSVHDRTTDDKKK